MARILKDLDLQNTYTYATDLLDHVGIVFDSEQSRDLFAKHGATVEGTTVKIPPSMVEQALRTLPDYEYGDPSNKKLVATSPFGNVPVLYDAELQTHRRSKLADAVKMFQLTQTSDLYECCNCAVLEPTDNDADDLYIGQVAMSLRYCDKYISSGMRATAGNAKGGNIYASQRGAIQLIKKFHDNWDETVMTQGICPMSPMKYDIECLENLTATVDEGQPVCLFPCTLTNMTGPAGLYDLVIHDIALALAGIVFIQLMKPGLDVSICPCAAATDMRAVQPAYGAPETAYMGMMIYEFFKSHKIACTVVGTMSDAAQVNYQSAVESFMSSFAPYFLSEIDNVWCYPGHMAAWYCGSFEKAILDEELMRNVNRLFKGVELVVDPKLEKLCAAAKDSGTFLTGRTPKSYRRDHYLTEIFSKHGVARDESPEKTDINIKVQKELERRIEIYREPDWTKAQRDLLQSHLPTACKY